jgi:hypothetical protein
MYFKLQVMFLLSTKCYFNKYFELCLFVSDYVTSKMKLSEQYFNSATTNGSISDDK